MLIYLDYNCFQRDFDDWKQTRIRIEAAVCEQVFQDAESGVHTLVWSFIHADENGMCPYANRRQSVEYLSTICLIKVAPDEGIRSKAAGLVSSLGLSAKDALHVASALAVNADFFLTCDDQLVRKCRNCDLAVNVMNPVEFMMDRERE